MAKEIIKTAEAKVRNVFESIDEIKDYNQEKVLEAFRKNKVGAEHFAYVSGYGHDDMGREALDRVYADIFKAESAIVRNNFVSGTHALSCVLFGVLRSGDKLLSVVGSPYDTMQTVIGTRNSSASSLIAHGVLYDEIPLKDGIEVDFEAIEAADLNNVKMVLIQRSRGYSVRKSVQISDIERIVKLVKSKNPRCICFVDNCYGEFVEEKEPIEVGADIVAGSLIKNPGGGIVECGGYVAGNEELVGLAAERLTAPGIGSMGGSMLNQTRLVFQGVFMAPLIVSEALKGAVLASQVFEDIGFKSTPKPSAKRTDIIQTIEFGSEAPLLEFCRQIQASSPVDSYLTPIPDDVPGYDNKLIMAGGTFIEGSTIELSADGPVREPYAAYLQGGLCYSHVKIALKNILEKINN